MGTQRGSNYTGHTPRKEGNDMSTDDEYRASKGIVLTLCALLILFAAARTARGDEVPLVSIDNEGAMTTALVEVPDGGDKYMPYVCFRKAKQQEMQCLIFRTKSNGAFWAKLFLKELDT